MPPRRISFSVTPLAPLRGIGLEEFVGQATTNLGASGAEVLGKVVIGAKSLFRYRYLQAGHKMSSAIILVETESGLYGIDLAADRQDEELLFGEALQIFTSVRVLKPGPP